MIWDAQYSVDAENSIQVRQEAHRFHADRMQFVCEIHNFWSTTFRWFSWYLHQKDIHSDLLAKFAVWKLNEKQYYPVKYNIENCRIMHVRTLSMQMAFLIRILKHFPSQI